MRKIEVLYDGKPFTYRWLSYLDMCRKTFENKQYHIQFVSFPNGLFKRYSYDELMKFSRLTHDIVALAFHRTSYLFDFEFSKISYFLVELKKHAAKIIWLDTSDGTGTSQFELLPYVDKYLKKQTLKDLNLYSQKFFQERYYLEKALNLKLLDSTERYNYSSHKSFIEDLSLINKIDVSWNIGLGDYFSNNYIFLLQSFFNCNRVSLRGEKLPLQQRDYDIHFRGRNTKTNNSYQRTIFFEKIKNSHYLLPDYSFDPRHNKYIRELANSKIVFSPFGFGEICIRDFESIKYGSLLVKPNMDYLSTFPNFFVPYETYCPVALDMSDFDLVVDYSLSNMDKAQKIVDNAYNLYRYYFTSSGMNEFVNHLINVIER